jgi:hypothetical protein
MIQKNIKQTLIMFSLSLICLNAIAGTDNIAARAKVSASTTLNNNYNADNVKDGLIGLAGKGEWACEGVTTDWGYVRFPWIQLDWGKPQAIEKIILYDRPSADEHIASGKLLFDDGSIIWVNEIPNDGTAKVVKFASKNVRSVRFVTTDGDGKDLGFSEIEVYPTRTQGTDYVGWVDPYIETNRGRYFFFITGARPFGMVGAAPHTRNKNKMAAAITITKMKCLVLETYTHGWYPELK